MAQGFTVSVAQGTRICIAHSFSGTQDLPVLATFGIVTVG